MDVANGWMVAKAGIEFPSESRVLPRGEVKSKARLPPLLPP